MEDLPSSSSSSISNFYGFQEIDESTGSFENVINSEMANQNHDSDVFDDSTDEDIDFDLNEFSANFEEEAHNFIEGPTSTNIFYPNIRAVENKLFKDRIRKYKASWRNSLQCEMVQEERMKFFGITTPLSMNLTFEDTEDPSSSSKREEKQCHSPDLFLTISTDDEEEISSYPNKPIELQPVEEEMGDKNSKSKAKLIAAIETFMIKLLKDLAINDKMSISVVNNDTWENSETSNGILSLKEPSKLIHRTVNFNNLKSQAHFTMIMYVITEVYHLLLNGTTCTERELYYKDPELIKNQIAIRAAVRDVCSILNTSPWELGIRQSSKGLISGAIKAHMSDDSLINCYFNDRATLIPNDIESITFLETTAKFVLIVEKDTIFQKFLQQNILKNLNTDLILITGKGYPDLGTRLMVKRIWDDFHLPIYVLVDADPFGIEIMLVYRYGSKAMAFSADQLACPQIRWIGIQPSEIESLAIPTLAQSNSDKKKLRELLQRTYINAEIRNELEILQRLDRKAEIEAVAGFSANFLVYDYIFNKIARNLVI